MRLFLRQTNLLETSPIVTRDGEPIDDAIVNVRLLTQQEVLIPGTEITLDHVEGGIYSKRMNVVEDVDADSTQLIEFSVFLGTTCVFYLLEPIKLIIRSKVKP